MAQYCDENGNVEYDTPEFRHALESLEAMSAALKDDQKVTYGQGGTIYGLTGDASSALLSDDSVLCLRFGENESISAGLSMLVVNASTPRKAEALEFAALAARRHEARSGPLLLSEIDYGALAASRMTRTSRLKSTRKKTSL